MQLSALPAHSPASQSSWCQPGQSHPVYRQCSCSIQNYVQKGAKDLMEGEDDMPFWCSASI